MADNHISHAYIFEGPLNVDKLSFARAFVKGVLCSDGRGNNCGKCTICDKIDHDNHEDILYVSREGLSIKDAAVEAVQERLNIKPLGSRNVVIVSDCDTMTARAQNRLLKTLEEPPGDSLIILLSENMENLVQTILSRCVKYRLEAETEAVEDAKAETIVRMALEGRPFYELLDETTSYLKDKDKTAKLLDSMEQVYRKFITDNNKDIALYRFEDLYENIKSIEDARKQMKQGMAAGNVLKKLLLKIS